MKSKLISTKILCLITISFLSTFSSLQAQWIKSGSRIFPSNNLNNPIIQIRDGSGNNSSQAAKLELLENASGTFNGGAYFLWNGSSNKLFIGTKFSNQDTPAMTISRSGNRVGIGTTNPPSGFLLAVNGRIKSKGVLCSVSGWADFVFDENYQLRSLEEVEKFITKNGHLPDIPSEKEVLKDGIELQQMNQKLLQKIEELTLYVIQQQKEINALKQAALQKS
ncbi:MULTISPECIES: hypothetical protein [Aquimarina]|uniref:hypothetical protein n=1 Tax=Aquimarina TaxID=290174 RepID=UPI0009433146|nr:MULTISPECIES: hypothetical protein [Aquimarina]